MTRSRYLVVTGLVFFASVLAAQNYPAAVDGQDLALDQFTVVVLPIEILTSEPKAPALAEDVYNEFLGQLSSIEGLYVLGRGSVVGFAESKLSPVEIARQLGAAFVVSGNIVVNQGAYYAQLDLSHAQGGGSSSNTALLAFLNPEHTQLTITASDGTPIELSPEDLIRQSVRRMAENISEWLFPPPPRDRDQVRAETGARFLDTSLSDRDRLDALSELTPGSRPNGTFFDGDKTLQTQVVVAAVQMAEMSENPAVRRHIWRHMAGVEDAYLIEPMIYALQNDTDDGVREEAAKALKSFLDEPRVRDALDYTSANNSSEVVRSAARSVTLSDEEQRAEYAAILLDEKQSDSDRSEALSRLRWGYQGKDWLTPELTPELTAAMVRLARNAQDARIRRSVWSSLRVSEDPELITPMLEALAVDQNEQVREEVVQALHRHHLDEPGIREALEAALPDEQSPLVRKRLEEALAAESD